MPAPLTDDQKVEARTAVLDAAEALFYARGVAAVGMDQVRDQSGQSLKFIYASFPTKDDLVVEMLRRRDLRWRGSMATRVEQHHNPAERLMAMCDWLHDWFSEPGFRGCAWVNIHGELGETSQAVLAEVRAHKAAFRQQIEDWSGPGVDAGAVFVVAEGAIVSAGITGDPQIAEVARRTIRVLLEVTPD